MTTKVDSYGLSKTYINDQLVKGMHYDATYDGNKLDLAIGDDKGDQIFIKMDNDDIMNLFTKHSSSTSIADRISQDYGNENATDLLSPIQQTNTNDAAALISPFFIPKIETKKTNTRTRSRKKKTPSPKTKSKSKTRRKTRKKTRSPSYRKTDVIPSINKTIF